MDGFRGKEVCELRPKEPLEASLNIHSTEPYVGHTHTCMSFPHVLWSGQHHLRLSHLLLLYCTLDQEM